MASPLVYLLDDDRHFTELLGALLKKLDVELLDFHVEDEYFNALYERKPDLILMDLSLGENISGFDVLQNTITNTAGKVPIIIMSGRSDSQAIAHGLELGATDYLVKPVDRSLITSKLSHYIQTSEMTEHQQQLKKVVDLDVTAMADLSARLTKIDEGGVSLVAPHLFSKGMVFKMTSELFKEIFGTDEPQLLTIHSTWVEKDQSCFGAYAEFDYTDDTVVEKVNHWLKRKDSSKSETMKEASTSS